MICEQSRKVRYGHKSSAEAAVYAMKQKGHGRMDAYSCEHCGGWHIGHSLKLVFDLFRRLERKGPKCPA